eukprot:TRINITY_DN12409_c0_g1_i1.p1 TRINITY_DN12409_c0_g1~~TRINITY_DN12409_c0_g1_i1.p1  ORF type:complete len:580 (+),score=99.23 TRINITY_DN12409_c0_g1_i1:79-1740(+)
MGMRSPPPRSRATLPAPRRLGSPPPASAAIAGWREEDAGFRTSLAAAASMRRQLQALSSSMDAGRSGGAGSRHVSPMRSPQAMYRSSTPIAYPASAEPCVPDAPLAAVVDHNVLDLERRRLEADRRALEEERRKLELDRERRRLAQEKAQLDMERRKIEDEKRQFLRARATCTPMIRRGRTGISPGAAASESTASSSTPIAVRRNMSPLSTNERSRNMSPLSISTNTSLQDSTTATATPVAMRRNASPMSFSTDSTPATATPVSMRRTISPVPVYARSAAPSLQDSTASGASPVVRRNMSPMPHSTMERSPAHAAAGVARQGRGPSAPPRPQRSFSPTMGARPTLLEKKIANQKSQGMLHQESGAGATAAARVLSPASATAAARVLSPKHGQNGSGVGAPLARARSQVHVQQVAMPPQKLATGAVCEVSRQLLEAARRGDADEARACLAEGAATGQCDDASWALHHAAVGGHVEVCRLLLESRGRADAFSRDFSTPLMLAVEEARLPVAKLLLGYGARADLKDENGFTALDRCDPRIRGEFAGLCDGLVGVCR